MTALASLLTDPRMSGLPIRAKYKHFKTICDHTFDFQQYVLELSFPQQSCSKVSIFNVVHEVLRDLQCLVRISAICVVEDVSIRLDILT